MVATTSTSLAAWGQPASNDNSGPVHQRVELKLLCNLHWPPRDEQFKLSPGYSNSWPAGLAFSPGPPVKVAATVAGR